VAALTPAVPVSIVCLQDADKIGHAGSIAVFGHNRKLIMGCGLSALPNPQQEIGDGFHGILSFANCGSGSAAAATRRLIKRRPAGVTPPTSSCDCRLEAGSVALHCALIGSTGYRADAIARGYEVTLRR
jgi:hypothetical protein